MAQKVIISFYLFFSKVDEYYFQHICEILFEISWNASHTRVRLAAVAPSYLGSSSRYGGARRCCECP